MSAASSFYLNLVKITWVWFGTKKNELLLFEIFGQFRIDFIHESAHSMLLLLFFLCGTLQRIIRNINCVAVVVVAFLVAPSAFFAVVFIVCMYFIED